jgi:hypothetical protein
MRPGRHHYSLLPSGLVIERIEIGHAAPGCALLIA